LTGIRYGSIEVVTVGVTATSETNIKPIRALSDGEALAWIAGKGRTETSAAALVRDWDWSPSKVRRRLASWSSAGFIKVKPGRHRGQTVITPVTESVAASPAGRRGRGGITSAPGPEPVAETATETAIETATNHPSIAVDRPSSAVAAGPAAGARATGFVNALAYAVAIALAGIAAYFSIRGMIVLFPGAPMAIVIMGVAMEAAKLVTVAFLAHQWRLIGRLSCAVLVTLVAGLAAINAAGVYSQLVAAHLGDRMTATSTVETEASALAARTEVQSQTVADLDRRLGQIDAAISEMVKRGRTSGALEAIGAQRKIREALVGQRRHEADALADLRSEAGAVAAKGRQIEVEAAPIMYVAQLLGGTTEQAIRLLILLMVLTCDPLALALTAAASRPKGK
jgi:hypothetical protein